MPRPLPCVSLILSFLATCAIASADTLFLRNGTVIEGEVVRDTVDGVVFNGKIAGIWGEQFFERSRVDRVERVPGDQGPASERSAAPKKPGAKMPAGTPPTSNSGPASTSPDSVPTPKAGTQADKPSEEIVEVEVTGQGATPEAAFDDALREALRQVVGAFVRADSKVEDGKLLEDRILSHSQGLIEKATKVGNAKLKDGSYQQAVKVLVRRGEVAAAVAEAANAESSVDSDTISARVHALREQKASASELLEALFDGWPAGVLTCTVAEDPKPVAGKAVPEGVHLDDGQVYISVLVDVAVDL